MGRKVIIATDLDEKRILKALTNAFTCRVNRSDVKYIGYQLYKSGDTLKMIKLIDYEYKLGNMITSLNLGTANQFKLKLEDILEYLKTNGAQPSKKGAQL